MGMSLQRFLDRPCARNYLSRVLAAIHPALLWAAGSILSLVLALRTPAAVQLTFVAMLGVGVASLLWAIWRAISSLADYDGLISAPLVIARAPEVFAHYRSLSASLRVMAAHLDPIHYDLALERLGQLDREVNRMAQGQIIFNDTETWRMAYAQLLRSPGLYRYRSVAHAKTPDYWQNEPGRQSMQVNFEVQQGGTPIERIVIVPDPFWPADQPAPMEPLNGWIDAQHQHGIAMKLVRLSALQNEPDLVADMGLYGNRAAGFQEINDRGLTTRFTLSFDFAEVLAAEQRWDRLALYATPYPCGGNNPI